MKGHRLSRSLRLVRHLVLGLGALVMLAPVTLFTVVITAIRAFQVFDTVAVLTGGGPNKASEVLLHTIYSEAFGYFRVGYAAALVVVFLVFILALSAIRVFVLERQRRAA